MEPPPHVSEEPRSHYEQQYHEEEPPAQPESTTSPSIQNQQQDQEDEDTTLQPQSDLGLQTDLLLFPQRLSTPSLTSLNESVFSFVPSTNSIHPSSIVSSEERIAYLRRRRRRPRRGTPAIVIFEDVTATHGPPISGWYASYRHTVATLNPKLPPADL
ncbi:hypothetical protein EG328_004050 [Venturia inaequalis]|uniref:Uncharacterized protein n=1 Tax=Venturia inaequalis TaxID=5025 RepID=A0A8H3UQR5_VENIN|nr:hypothetical protein EG328_004050 [Venturia inaequalis]KAE9977328.1 hypothetical protein EG327_007767 [Venturia inaequalis]